MANISPIDGDHEVALTVMKYVYPVQNPPSSSSNANKDNSGCFVSVPFMQKLIAEVVGTYLLIFVGCASVLVNENYDKVVTLPGIAMVWGLTVMILVYSLGHISGAHFNPAVSIAFATCNRFSWKHVPAYISAQVLGSTVASGTLRLIFNGKQDHFVGTVPAGTDMESFVIEFVITFYLMFVISGVADNRTIGELAGLVVGATILVNVFVGGPISGASMNPARSLGPAIVSNQYKGIWIYMVSPVFGAVSGAWFYNMVRFTDKPLGEITKTASFLRREGSA
ncbi:hypothetical protein Ddye_024337 [Dipteronia dyeriana]|uniref:Uncharacterized protein n=1 Tax=Dipteronia dyeriana TaxID=168575 RepID=A0AAD9TVK3_9ROSI|nr:hypothetical protein Ddye_024337 [Dipteronia dyeriana]